MKVHGLCQSCGKIVRVNASGVAVGMAVSQGGGVVVGVCDKCIEAEEAGRRRPGSEIA